MLTSFRHHALAYSGREDFAASCAGAVRAGLDRDERPTVLAGADTLDEVRQALGEPVAGVSLIPVDEHARNPGRLLAMLHAYATRAAAGRVLGVCQVDVHGRTRAQLTELHLAECMLNTAPFERLPLSVVCLYDAQDLDDEAMAQVRRSHPSVAGVDANPDFDEALATVLHAEPLDPPPPAAPEHTVRLEGLSALRATVKAFAHGNGLALDRTDDLVLAANEIVTNSVRYGGGRAAVRMWVDGNSVVLQSSDHGYLRDPMVGRLAPRPDAGSGRGLWLAHHLCDLVQLRSGESSGTTVRLFVDR